MNGKHIAAIKDSLLKEKSHLENTATELQGRLESLARELSCVSAALSALDGVESKATTRAVGKNRPSLPAANKAEVVTFINDILSSGESVDQTQLRAQLDAKVTEAGLSRLGLSLRFNEALADPRFLIGVGGIRLKDESVTVSRSVSQGVSTPHGVRTSETHSSTAAAR
jgi:hypothetical protein